VKIIIAIFLLFALTACLYIDDEVAAEQETETPKLHTYIDDFVDELESEEEDSPAIYELCAECGDHPIGTSPVRDFRPIPQLPLNIRDIYLNGFIEYFDVPLAYWLAEKETVHEVYFNQVPEIEWPLYPNMLIWAEETIYDLAIVWIELGGDEEMAFEVQEHIFEVDALTPNDAIIFAARFVHYLIPRGGIIFTDSDGNHHRMLISDSSPRGGCWPHWWLSIHDDNWAGWVPLQYNREGIDILPTTYIVVPGDSMSSIAYKFFGTRDVLAVSHIAETNNITDPNGIFVGMELLITPMD